MNVSDFEKGIIHYVVPGKLRRLKETRLIKGPGALYIVKKETDFEFPWAGRFAISRENAMNPGGYVSMGGSAVRQEWQVLSSAILFGFIPAESIANCRSVEDLLKFLV
jgi:hypothetical protein